MVRSYRPARTTITTGAANPHRDRPRTSACRSATRRNIEITGTAATTNRLDNQCARAMSRYRVAVRQ
jgi:hypothetical protein